MTAEHWDYEAGKEVVHKMLDELFHVLDPEAVKEQIRLYDNFLIVAEGVDMVTGRHFLSYFNQTEDESFVDLVVSGMHDLLATLEE